MLALPFVSEVWQIYALIFVLSACAAGFTPLFQATIPDIVEDERLYTRALSLSRLAYDLESLLSPTAAALLLVFMSFDVLFVLNALAFIASALLLVSVTLPQAHPTEAVESIWKKITWGSRIYLKTPRLRGLLGLNMAVSAAGAMQIINTVIYVKSGLGLGDTAVAVAFAAGGGGSMGVALSLPRVLDHVPRRPTMLLGGVLMSASLFMGLLQPTFALLLVLWFMLGAGTSLVLTPTGQLLRQSCHEQDRPAVFSAQFSLSHACWLIAYPLAGVLGVWVGLGTAFLVLGVITLAATVVAARTWPRHDPAALWHEHTPQAHAHLHYHDEHHPHAHEGWEGPEPHAHPHRHPALCHRHAFVIDGHHLHWPV